MHAFHEVLSSPISAYPLFPVVAYKTWACQIEATANERPITSYEAIYQHGCQSCNVDQLPGQVHVWLLSLLSDKHYWADC